MANKKTGKAKGRPSKYTKEIANIICKKLSEGMSLRRICDLDEKMPAESTVRQWARDDVHGFYTQYARARDMGIDSIVDEILDIADDATNDYVERERSDGSTYIALDKEAVMRSQLRCHMRQWYASKLAPKKYDKPVPEDKDKPDAPQEEYTLAPDEEKPVAPIL